MQIKVFSIACFVALFNFSLHASLQDVLGGKSQTPSDTPKNLFQKMRTICKSGETKEVKKEIAQLLKRGQEGGQGLSEQQYRQAFNHAFENGDQKSNIDKDAAFELARRAEVERQDRQSWEPYRSIFFVGVGAAAGVAATLYFKRDVDI